MNSVLLVVDRDSQEDLLLWSAVARAVAQARPGRLAILHAPGETVERALEGEGLDASTALGDEPGSARALVRRALLEENRRAAQALTDEGVPAVATPGLARDLLGDGPSSWFATSVRTGAVPVVSAVRSTGDRLVAVDLEAATKRLAGLLDAPVRILRLVRGVVAAPVTPQGISQGITTVSGLSSSLSHAAG